MRPRNGTRNCGPQTACPVKSRVCPERTPPPPRARNPPQTESSCQKPVPMRGKKRLSLYPGHIWRVFPPSSLTSRWNQLCRQEPWDSGSHQPCLARPTGNGTKCFAVQVSGSEAFSLNSMRTPKNGRRKRSPSRDNRFLIDKDQRLGVRFPHSVPL